MSIEAPFGGSYMSTDKLPENLGQDVDFTEVYQASVSSFCMRFKLMAQ